MRWNNWYVRFKSPYCSLFSIFPICFLFLSSSFTHLFYFMFYDRSLRLRNCQGPVEEKYIFSATKENSKLSRGAKLIKRKLLRKKLFSTLPAFHPMTSTVLMTELLCANLCGEVSTIQGCIVQTACVPEAHRSCVPWGQHEQIPLQEGSLPGSSMKPTQLGKHAVRARSLGIYKR